eukprot:6574924-Pyramimonas_sp.AAC.1
MFPSTRTPPQAAVLVDPLNTLGLYEATAILLSVHGPGRPPPPRFSVPSWSSWGPLGLVRGAL